MKSHAILALCAVAATPLVAEETRQLDAHEHGVGQLNIAFDGDKIAMELHAPGADIVGFEYEATTEADRAAIDSAVAKLARPLDLFVLPAAAACSVVQASASLESEEGNDDHDHGDKHAHEDHDKHSGADHDDHNGNTEEHAGNHTEFHAEYLLTCADPAAASEITFAYFESFPNALEVEVQVISDTGATAFEVERDEPTLDLRGMF